MGVGMWRLKCLWRRWATLTVFASVALGAGAAQMIRCTDPDGRVTYSDRPCASNAKAAEVVGSDRSAVAPQSRDASGANKAPDAQGGASPSVADAGPPERVRFTGLPADDYRVALAQLDAIRGLGATCRASLRQPAPEQAACNRFMARFRAGAEWDQVRWRLTTLNAEPDATRVFRREISTIQALTQEATHDREFALAYLRQPRP